MSCLACKSEKHVTLNGWRRQLVRASAPPPCLVVAVNMVFSYCDDPVFPSLIDIRVCFNSDIKSAACCSGLNATSKALQLLQPNLLRQCQLGLLQYCVLMGNSCLGITVAHLVYQTVNEVCMWTVKLNSADAYLKLRVESNVSQECCSCVFFYFYSGADWWLRRW